MDDHMEEDEEGLAALREQELSQGFGGEPKARRKLDYLGEQPGSLGASSNGTSVAATPSLQIVSLDSAIDDFDFDVDIDKIAEQAKAAQASSRKRLRNEDDEPENNEIDFAGILAARKRNQLAPTRRGASILAKSSPHIYFNRPPSAIETREVTDGRGRRIFVQIEDEDALPSNVLDGTAVIAGYNSTLNIAFKAVKKQAEESERYEEFVRQQRLEQEALNAAHMNVAEEKGRGVRPASNLWVDKYQPHSFLDLLSEEKTNRKVLSWLKEWDGIVFDRPVTVSKLRQFPSRGGFNKFRGGGGRGGGRGGGQADNGRQEAPKPTGTLGTPIETTHTPRNKTILISGPPGIGKTTLAHVIAAHAGYEPIEFNASDDRTSASFLPKVLDVIETQSAFTEGLKPKCLIIDEIDGVLGGEGKGAIKGLVSILDEEGHKKKSVAKLKRPIICICNDPWAPALARLRDRALMFRLEPPSVANLAQRLSNVCGKEGIRAEKSMLNALCELTNNDIRSCLNTLQFLSRSSKSLTSEMLTSANFGNKDIQINLFDVWRQIFVKEQKSAVVQAIIAARRQKQLVDDEDQIGTAPTSSTRTYKVNTQSGDTDQLFSKVAHADVDKLLEGCFEHYLQVGYSDALLSKTSKAADAMSFASIMWRSMRSHQHYGLGAYLPVVAVQMNLLCSVPRLNHVFTYPRSLYNAKTKLEETKNMIKTFKQGLSAHVVPYLTDSTLLVEFLPLFLRIISPKIDSMAPNLMSEAEKNLLTKVVAVYIDYGLSFDEPEDYENADKNHHPLANSAGSQLYKLHPPIDKVTRFEGIDSPCDAVGDMQRQMLAGQIQLTKFTRLNKGAAGGASAASMKGAPIFEAPSVARQTKAAEAKAKAEEEVVEKDFFGRKIIRKVASSDKNPAVDSKQATATGSAQRSQHPLLYKFHEGFTNAVRRKVYMKDLL